MWRVTKADLYIYEQLCALLPQSQSITSNTNTKNKTKKKKMIRVSFLCAFVMDNGWSGLIVFGFGDPQFLKSGQGWQRCFLRSRPSIAFRRGNDFGWSLNQEPIIWFLFAFSLAIPFEQWWCHTLHHKCCYTNLFGYQHHISRLIGRPICEYLLVPIQWSLVWTKLQGIGIVPAPMVMTCAIKATRSFVF